MTSSEAHDVHGGSPGPTAGRATDSSDDLVTWLRAQLDEDERIAKACTEPFLEGDRTGMDGLHPQILRYVWQWTPARVFTEVEAKRRLIEYAEVRLKNYIGTGAQVAFEWYAVRLLALPYADRPGYRDEWRPQ